MTRLSKQVNVNASVKSRSVLAAATAVVLLVASGAAYRVTANYVGRSSDSVPLPQEALDKLPLQIGDWVGRDLPLSEAIIKATDADAHIYRAYARQAESVVLYVAYGVKTRDLMPHRPEVCYPGGGWTLDDRVYGTLLEFVVTLGAICVLLLGLGYFAIRRRAAKVGLAVPPALRLWDRCWIAGICVLIALAVVVYLIGWWDGPFKPDTRDTELLLADGSKLQCRVLRFSRAGLATQKITVLNYYIVDGDYYPDVSLLRLKAWRGSSGVRYMAQVQITSSGNAGLSADSAVRSVRDFAIDSAAAIYRLFPDAGKDSGKYIAQVRPALKPRGTTND